MKAAREFSLRLRIRRGHRVSLGLSSKAVYSVFASNAKQTGTTLGIPDASAVARWPILRRSKKARSRSGSVIAAGSLLRWRSIRVPCAARTAARPSAIREYRETVSVPARPHPFSAREAHSGSGPPDPEKREQALRIVPRPLRSFPAAQEIVRSQAAHPA